MNTNKKRKRTPRLTRVVITTFLALVLFAILALSTFAAEGDSGECGDNHSFTNYVSDGNATCTENGTKTAKCDRCNATDTTIDVMSKLGHSFINYEPNDDATCQKDGTKTAKCERCDEEHTIMDAGTRLEHVYNGLTCIRCQSPRYLYIAVILFAVIAFILFGMLAAV